MTTSYSLTESPAKTATCTNRGTDTRTVVARPDTVLLVKLELETLVQSTSDLALLRYPEPPLPDPSSWSEQEIAADI
jgi:hypothetical protein